MWYVAHFVQHWFTGTEAYDFPGASEVILNDMRKKSTVSNHNKTR